MIFVFFDFSKIMFFHESPSLNSSFDLGFKSFLMIRVALQSSVCGTYCKRTVFVNCGDFNVSNLDIEGSALYFWIQISIYCADISSEATDNPVSRVVFSCLVGRWTYSKTFSSPKS